MQERRLVKILLLDPHTKTTHLRSLIGESMKIRSFEDFRIELFILATFQNTKFEGSCIDNHALRKPNDFDRHELAIKTV